jgi:hypothetical protein
LKVNKIAVGFDSADMLIESNPQRWYFRLEKERETFQFTEVEKHLLG